MKRLQLKLISSSTMEQPKPTCLKFSIISILVISSLLTLVTATYQDTTKDLTGSKASGQFDENNGHERLTDELQQSASTIRGQLTETPSTSPSITSVHQVWTSASSGSLDELSPEIISKLRNDVPFLAAYALRPRLVGGLMSHQSGGNKVIQAEREQSPDGLEASAALTSRGSSNGALVLETGASSPHRSTESLVPRLGDFSEFRVETSSTSKSEHHHNRKTSLRRKGEEDLRMKKRVLSEASQLVKRRRRQNNNRLGKAISYPSGGVSKFQRRNHKSLNRDRKASKPRRREAAVKSQARASRLRSKLNRRNLQHHMDIIRHGRYLQGPSLGAAEDADQVSPQMGASKGGDTSGVKGGSGPKSADKKPFYSSVLPASNEKSPSDEGDDESNERNGRADDDRGDQDEPEMTTTPNQLPEPKERSQSEGGTGGTINEVDDDIELDRLPEPKRVGDPDVDEEGDTVTVMPKSDGVDDDPELPDYEDDGAQGSPEEASGDEKPSEEPESENDEEPRTKRVNRERPNEQPRDQAATTSGDDESQQDDGPSSSAGGGGGIGATVGGGAAVSEGTQDDESEDSMRADDDDDMRATGGMTAKPGVEFAEDDQIGEKKSKTGKGTEGVRPELDGTGDEGDDVRRGTGSPSTASGGSGRSETEASEFESKKEKSDTEEDRKIDDSSQTKSAGAGRETPLRPSLEADMPDVDYRDDSDEPERKGAKTAGTDKEVNSDKEHAGKDKEHKKRTEKSEKCEDGSYNHHDDHHHGHHDHHDSIKWLQDAIPGEPNEDYPVLSKAGATNFSCSDQKYPGYYADVEARCQVFHICQADGRQDSFLCPNGTIFSQKHYVCVWWNSVNCEDAPKYYNLNALLYKSSSSNKNRVGSSDLKPLDGERISDGANIEGADEESSIDSLIRNMRRNKQEGESLQPDGLSQAGFANEGSKMNRRVLNNGIGPDDEATIQKKSTNVEDEPSPARLRTGNVEPRRKRRASMKQAPRKLSSRRTARVSKRRKLRHGIKPKRRA